MTDTITPRKLRIIAANLTSGQDQSYERGDPGSRILSGLAKAELSDGAAVVMLQEANVGGNNDEAAFGAWVRDTFGPEYGFVRSSADEQIPNAVVAPKAWFRPGPSEIDDTIAPNRDHARALLEIPGLGQLVAVSTHLLTRGPQDRLREGTELAQAVRASLATMPGAFAAVGGDFNTDRHGEAVFSARGIGGVFVTNDAVPVDERGNDGTNSNRDKPYDGVYATQNLVDKQVPVELAPTVVFQDGGVIDTRTMGPALLQALGDVHPNDSGVKGMQHMAVVKDFKLRG
jgi:endonuclease/exonuclease/phosphatase family metal-dependent hydrolase